MTSESRRFFEEGPLATLLDECKPDITRAQLGHASPRRLQSLALAPAAGRSPYDTL